jgi:hypothetical protein
VGIEQASWHWKVVRRFVSEHFSITLERSACVAHLHPAHHNASQVGAEEALDVGAPLGGDPAVSVPQACPHAQPVTGEQIGGKPIARPKFVYRGLQPRRFRVL